MCLVGAGDASFDMRVQIAALADIALEAFAEFAEVVPESGQGSP